MGRLRRRFEEMNMQFEGNETDQQYYLAYKRVKRIKGFYVHLLVYVLVNLFILARKYYEKGSVDFYDWDTFSTPIFWGIGIIAHASSVFGKDLFFGDNWEEKKIQEFMDKEKSKASNWE